MLKSIDMKRPRDLERLRVLLELIADRTRQDILFLFLERAEWNAGQIAERFAVSRPTVSHHVNLLVRGGVLECRKEGKERWYTFRREDVVSLLRMAADLMAGCC